MRVLLVAVLLAFSLHLPAADLWFEPPAPTSHSFVKLHVRSGSGDACLPRGERVTRSGNTIDVFWERPAGCSGVSVPAPWGDEAAIGVLEPGVYEVRVHIEDAPPRSVTLVVGDAAPPFVVQPSIVSIGGGETIAIYRFRDDDLCRLPSTVTIGGVAAPVVSRDCGLVQVTAPPHAAGAVDVTVKSGEETLTARAALRYVDPAAAPDDSAFERVLVPLLYEGPGAYGSQWVTEGRMYPMGTARPLRWLNDALREECAIGPCEGHDVDLTRFGNHPAGLLLFIPRDMGEVEAKTFARDVSREHASWGVQVPIVRENDFTRDREMRFPDVPFTAPYRALLRVYGVDAAASHVRVRAGGRERIVTLTGACGFYVTPCNSAQPAFAAVDLLEAFPELAGTGRASVAVGPSASRALRYWAFVSVTNNATQHVTLITP